MKKHLSSILAFIMVFSAVIGGFAAEASAQTRNIEVRITVSNAGSDTSKDINLNAALFGVEPSTAQIKSESFNLNPQGVTEGSFSSRTALFHIASLAPGASQTITIDYQVDNSAVGAAGTGDLGQYLLPSKKIESDNASIIAKSNEINTGVTDSYTKALNNYNWVIGYMVYDLNSPYRNKGALSAYNNGVGVCEDYASLFVALNRAQGIPSRIVNGFADPAGTGDAWGAGTDMNAYRHSWAEFYIEGQGWLPADPTFDIYSGGNNRYFGQMGDDCHIPQNYQDNSLTASSIGGKLKINWDNVME